MPQMSPMMWMFLYNMYTMTAIVMSTYLYFSMSKNPHPSTPNHLNPCWKW